MICRRCAVYIKDAAGNPEPQLVFATGDEAIKHLVQVHGLRAEKLLSYMLSMVTGPEAIINQALRDHNAEGDYDPREIQ